MKSCTQNSDAKGRLWQAATGGFALLSLLAANVALADGDAAAMPTIDTGDTAWVLMSAALVLLMTPALAFFYGGMVRSKNVLSTLFQNVAALAVIGLLWGICGYSLAFSGDVGGLIGNLNWLFLRDVGQAPNADYAATIPHLAFMIFQCMFAVISPALITGAVAERLNFKAWVAFLTVWSLVVYVPIAHWVWGVGGWIRNLGGLDFAGGLVVHMSAGYSALVAALLLGKRKDFGRSDIHPYDVSFVMLGTALLWFGWFGFNAGSALGANGLAAHAFATTFFAAAAAAASWVVVDTFIKGKPSALGGCVGAVAGLVAITPAAGFVSFGSAMLIGLATGAICNYMAIFVKEKLKLDDTLDVFACHGVGGTLGTILVGVFADKSINPAGNNGLLYGGHDVMRANIIGGIAVIAFSVVATYIIFKAVSKFANFRVSETDEELGLDKTQHGEVINSVMEVLSTRNRTSMPHDHRDRKSS
ncbi:MAG: ammonium transporter [Oligoflexales bacterium]